MPFKDIKSYHFPAKKLKFTFQLPFKNIKYYYVPAKKIKFIYFNCLIRILNLIMFPPKNTISVNFSCLLRILNLNMFPPKNIISIHFSCLLRILNLINEKVSPKGMGGGLGSLAVNTVFNPYLYLNNIILNLRCK